MQEAALGAGIEIGGGAASFSFRAKRNEQAGRTDVVEAWDAGGGATVGDGSESILETSPGAEITMLFVMHRAFFGTIDPGLGEVLLETGDLP